jgi:hypothetical protein
MDGSKPSFRNRRSNASDATVLGRFQAHLADARRHG